MEHLTSRRSFLALASTTTASLAGCATSPGPERTERTTEYTAIFQAHNEMNEQVTPQISLVALSEEGTPTGDPITESYTIEPDQRISLDDRLDTNVAYRVDFSITDGVSKSWNLLPYEARYVTIYSPTNVESTLAEA